MLRKNIIIKTIFIFITFHLGITDEDVKDYDTNELLTLFKSLTEFRPDDVKNRDVTFYLYTRNVSNLKISLERREDISVTKISKFIIHGWIDNHNRSWYHHLTDEYLKNGDFNLIHVDWWRVARSFYLSSAHNTKLVGRRVANFILNHNLNPKNVHLIGHSLGAHIAGFASQIIQNRTGVRVKRISALDPAGPAFWKFLTAEDERLSENDADIVDVIHTDGGVLGCYPRIGTFDIYINGGIRIQPDCYQKLIEISSPAELFEDAYCSHTRAYVRFIEMINEKKYTCKKCDSLLQYVVGLCLENEDYTFGAEDINETMTGVCFVSTMDNEV